MFNVIKNSLYKELYKFKLLRQKVQGISLPGTLLEDTVMNNITNILAMKNATV